MMDIEALLDGRGTELLAVLPPQYGCRTPVSLGEYEQQDVEEHAKIQQQHQHQQDAPS